MFVYKKKIFFLKCGKDDGRLKQVHGQCSQKIFHNLTCTLNDDNKLVTNAIISKCKKHIFYAMFDLVERSRIKCNHFWLMCLQDKRAFICAWANVLL